MNPSRKPPGRAALLALPALIAMLIAPTTAWAQAAPPKEKKTDPKINDPYEKSGVDVAGYVKRFETDDREVFARRAEIVASLGLKPGMAVADVGAGTGLFTRLFADQVGPEGRVFAVDVSRDFLKHVAEESRKLGQTQVETILGTQTGTTLKPGSVDLVFICDVFHHFEAPEKMLASIHQALRPGGSLVLIEFDRVEGKSSDFILKHVRASQQEFILEIERAGFALDAPEPDKALKFKENFLARFRRIDKPASGEGENP